MRLIHCACGTGPHAEVTIPGAEQFRVPEVPSRKDLRFLDEIAREVLPVDPTPTLAEIQAMPNVPHQGAPEFAPQEPRERLRVIVAGTDAALGAVLTRMMRADYLWAEVGFIPADPTSPAAACWGIPHLLADATSLAAEAPITPASCIRTDTGEVVAGSAEIRRGGGGEFVGEIVVDSATLLLRTGEEDGAGRFGGAGRGPREFGARLVPTMDAPGIACAPLVADRPGVLSGVLGGTLGRLRSRGGEVRASEIHPDGARVLTGRAVQTGGADIQVIVDAIPKPRTVDRATFYRHLRDIQSVRNAENS